ncbi:hypothetical protein [Arcicella rigui]|uniref:Uncharacterized protein n=1 Tax=Arcicella rigui TaxID=797020 RepID=A0ABU5Q5K7_9BACT|nr:hypothetical protein [Arcicella rigui]MEA5138125.1 hypothetical protein [Arcicella rigui]
MKKFATSFSLLLLASSIIVAQKTKEKITKDTKPKEVINFTEMPFVSLINEQNVKNTAINPAKLNETARNLINFTVGKEDKSYFEVKENTMKPSKENTNEACDVCQGKGKFSPIYGIVKIQSPMSSLENPKADVHKP